MGDWAEWDKQLRGSEEDIRAEVVISDLLMDGLINEQDFFLIPNGGFHRIISKDIDKISPTGTNTWDLNRAMIEVNRKGIYDGMPEAIFHQNNKPKSFKSISEIKADVVRHNKIEDNARKYFGPLDHELLMTRCSIEINERKMTAEILNSTRRAGLKKFWGLPDYFSKEEQGRLLVMIPMAHRICMKLVAAAQAFATILNMPIKIDREEVDYGPGSTDATMRLGHGLLGVDTVTDGAVDDSDSQLLISVGPLSVKQAAQYSPQENGHRKISYLSDLFLPADMDYRIDILIEPDEKGTELTEEGTSTRLGVTSYLN